MSVQSCFCFLVMTTRPTTQHNVSPPPPYHLKRKKERKGEQRRTIDLRKPLQNPNIHTQTSRQNILRNSRDALHQAYVVVRLHSVRIENDQDEEFFGGGSVFEVVEMPDKVGREGGQRGPVRIDEGVTRWDWKKGKRDRETGEGRRRSKRGRKSGETYP